MKKNRPLIEYNLVNHIINITIVDGWLNKNIIKAQAPSEYMQKFMDDDPNVQEYMKSLMIYNLKEYGVFDDDYDKSFEHRIKEIHTEMVSRIEAIKEDYLEAGE